jgi:hypothetical protein
VANSRTINIITSSIVVLVALGMWAARVWFMVLGLVYAFSDSVTEQIMEDLVL